MLSTAWNCSSLFLSISVKVRWPLRAVLTVGPSVVTTSTATIALNGEFSLRRPPSLYGVTFDQPLPFQRSARLKLVPPACFVLKPTARQLPAEAQAAEKSVLS